MTKFIKVIATVVVAAIGQTLFAYNGGYENSSLTDITIGGVTYKGYGNNTVTKRTESGTTIAANAYAQCSKLTSVSLAGVTSLGNAAFAYSALTSVELPATLKTIGYIPFGGCKSLASVTINSTAFMTSADESKEPFRDCAALKTVTAKCAPPAWDFKKVFPNVTSVSVPSANVEAWKSSYPTLNVSVAATYNIKFCTNDSSGRTKTVEFSHGASTALPKFSTFGWDRNGFTFAGWATENGGKLAYADGAEVVSPVAAGQTMSLYPLWSTKSGYYILRFNANDGSGRIWSVGFQHGVNTAIPKIATGFCWTRAGYRFRGWATSADATAATYEDNEVVKTAASAGATRNLYALWSKGSTYDIKFCTNDSSGRAKIEEFSHGVATALPKFSTFGWDRNGFTFAGWATENGGKIVYADGASVTAPVAVGQVMRLYPVWSTKSGYYILRFNANDGSGRIWSVGFQYGVNTAIPKIATGFCWTRAGYRFMGWATSADATVATYADNGVVKTAANAGETKNVYAVWSSVASEYRSVAVSEYRPVAVSEHRSLDIAKDEQGIIIRNTTVYSLDGVGYAARVCLYPSDTADMYAVIADVDIDGDGYVFIGEGRRVNGGDFELELFCDGVELVR